MVKTWQLRSSLWVPHTPDVVFPFFAEAKNLQALTPPWLSFEILTPQPFSLQQGTLIDYRITVRGFRMRWRTRIASFEPSRRFVDEQIRGPYSVWHHTHTFTAQDGGTLLTDTVVMRPKGGLLAGLVFSMFVRKDVERIFRYRLQRMAELFGSKAEFGVVAWESSNVSHRERQESTTANDLPTTRR